MTAHKDLTGADLHEPKGIEDATSGQIYTADGAGSGAWTTPGAESIVSGTKMLFQQTSAPTGWTKDTTHNDKVLRVVSGTASSGGSVAFSTVFGRTATDGHSITQAELPNCTFPDTLAGTVNASIAGSDVSATGGSGKNYASDALARTVTITGSVTSGGSDTAHTHGLDLRVQYVDLIIATKD